MKKTQVKIYLQALRNVLLGHVVVGEAVRASELNQDDVVLESAEGAPLRVNVYLKSRFYHVSMGAVC